MILGDRHQTPLKVPMDSHRFIAVFHSALIFTFLGCVRDSTPPKADVPVAKNQGARNESAKKQVAIKAAPDSKVKSDLTDNPEAVSKLLRNVADISPDDVTRYETFLDDPTSINATAYQGALPYTGDDVRGVIRLGLEMPAVSALLKFVQQKQNSTDKSDLLICCSLGSAATKHDADGRARGIQ